MSYKAGTNSTLDTEASCAASIGECNSGKCTPERTSPSRKQRILKKKGNWSVDEDALLLLWVQERGPCKWTQCSKGIRGRCGKQCRERWVNILNPSVKKGKWSHQEQTQIFDSLRAHLTAWSTIAKILPGRTENSIKNYFYSSLRRIQGNPIINIVRECITAPRAVTSESWKASAERFLSELNVLGQLICQFVVDVRNAGSFYELLRSQLMLEISKEAVLDFGVDEDLLSYPMVVMPSASPPAPTLQMGMSLISALTPRCWNCLSSDCCRHGIALTAI